MRVLQSIIEIGDITFDFVNDLTISSTWKTLTDTGTIVIPRKLNALGRNIVGGDNPLMKVGDKVSVSIGYRKDVGEGKEGLSKILDGYVSEIKPKMPMTISVQDGMFLLKKNSITASHDKIKLKDLLTEIIPPEIPFEAMVDITLGQIRINRASSAQVLEEIKGGYGLESWFRDGKLYVGLAYVPELRKTHTFQFNKNIIADSLTYRKAEDVQVKLTVKNMFPNNTYETYTTGGVDLSGKELSVDNCQETTLVTYNLSKEDSIDYAKRQIAKLRYTGFYGGFEVFGEPFVKHGDDVKLIDPVLPERNGNYLVKQVTYKFGMGGIRQQIEIANKIL